MKRHQKFIEQLLAEKTDLTQKCDSLAQQIKEMEQKIQRDLKVITERHVVELQRAKEHVVASEKIRRERWLEVKTSKIKVIKINSHQLLLANIIHTHKGSLLILKLEMQFFHLCKIFHRYNDNANKILYNVMKLYGDK